MHDNPLAGHLTPIRYWHEFKKNYIDMGRGLQFKNIYESVMFVKKSPENPCNDIGMILWKATLSSSHDKNFILATVDRPSKYIHFVTFHHPNTESTTTSYF